MRQNETTWKTGTPLLLSCCWQLSSKSFQNIHLRPQSGNNMPGRMIGIIVASLTPQMRLVCESQHSSMRVEYPASSPIPRRHGGQLVASPSYTPCLTSFMGRVFPPSTPLPPLPPQLEPFRTPI